MNARRQYGEGEEVWGEGGVRSVLMIARAIVIVCRRSAGRASLPTTPEQRDTPEFGRPKLHFARTILVPPAIIFTTLALLPSNYLLWPGGAWGMPPHARKRKEGRYYHCGILGSSPVSDCRGLFPTRTVRNSSRSIMEDELCLNTANKRPL